MTVSKGTPVAVTITGSYVQVWVESPTGDSSDSLIFEIPCGDELEAWRVMLAWRKAWNIQVTSDESLEFSRSIHPAELSKKFGFQPTSPEFLG